MEYVAVFAPLVGALMAGLLGKFLGDKGAQFVTCALMVAASYAAVNLFLNVNLGVSPRTVTVMDWISSGGVDVNWALRFDQLSAVMAVVITLVSTAVHIYSVGYMHHDEAKARFMAYLSLFTFAMLMLVTADNLIQLFFGWEGVGLASYLLIGFWNQKESANKASIKAFVMNRIGDFGLALGIFAIFFIFGSVNFNDIFPVVAEKSEVYVSFLGFNVHGISLIAGLLFIGAMGKSAQLGLHTWLPDAMEGPTPVSALIHAATMVTAGVFLVCRMSPIYEYAPYVRDFIAVLGALTAFVAATIALTQFDIKRVIAYSTMSQLGYMFFALGVSAYGAAMFHLFTHAFFKALLFLGAGSVIHAMSDEQDMRKMGGIWKLIPQTYILMWIGNLALAGIPFFAGYYSKDMILEAAYASHSNVGLFAYWVGIAAAFMTAFYSWRLLFMTFHGKPRSDEKVMAHVHESPMIMTIPLYFLAIGALFAGFLFHGMFVGADRLRFWGDAIFVMDANDTVAMAHHVATWVKYMPLVAGVTGILLAYMFYIRSRHLPAVMAGMFPRVHAFLFNKWYVDELYNATGLKGSFALGRFLWKTGDVKIVDGLGPNGAAAVVAAAASGVKKVQSGYVYHYAFAMLIGVVGLVSFYVYLIQG